MCQKRHTLVVLTHGCRLPDATQTRKVLQIQDVTPEDYKRLLNELAHLRKELEKERLRADFYKEMVAYGEEVYGIRLKKAGTK